MKIDNFSEQFREIANIDLSELNTNNMYTQSVPTDNVSVIRQLGNFYFYRRVCSHGSGKCSDGTSYDINECQPDLCKLPPDPRKYPPKTKSTGIMFNICNTNGNMPLKPLRNIQQFQSET